MKSLLFYSLKFWFLILVLISRIEQSKSSLPASASHSWSFVNYADADDVEGYGGLWNCWDSSWLLSPMQMQSLSCISSLSGIGKSSLNGVVPYCQLSAYTLLQTSIPGTISPFFPGRGNTTRSLENLWERFIQWHCITRWVNMPKFNSCLVSCHPRHRVYSEKRA